MVVMDKGITKQSHDPVTFKAIVYSWRLCSPFAVLTATNAAEVPTTTPHPQPPCPSNARLSIAQRRCSPPPVASVRGLLLLLRRGRVLAGVGEKGLRLADWRQWRHLPDGVGDDDVQRPRWRRFRPQRRRKSAICTTWRRSSASE